MLYIDQHDKINITLGLLQPSATTLLKITTKQAKPESSALKSTLKVSSYLNIYQRFKTFKFLYRKLNFSYINIETYNCLCQVIYF